MVWIPNGSRFSRDCYVGVSLGIPNQWAPCNRPSKGELEFPCLDQKSLEPEGEKDVKYCGSKDVYIHIFNVYM